MYSRILVPLDGSELSEQVLPYVELLAGRLGCPVHLLRVMEPLPDSLADSAHGVYPHRIVESEKSHLEDYLSEKASELKQHGLEVSTSCEVGDAAEQIIDSADDVPQTLIAMSTHGRSGVTRWLMGSVANKVLHSAGSPLLLIRGREQVGSPPTTINTVIVPLDHSATSEQILPHVVELAKGLDLEIHLTWAFPLIEGHYTDIGYGATIYGVPPYGEISKEIEAEAQRYFASVQETLQEQGVTRVETHLLWGHPASTIVDLVRETPNSMVALTTHGRTGPGRWLMGSVADHIVRESSDPVLIVRVS